MQQNNCNGALFVWKLIIMSNNIINVKYCTVDWLWGLKLKWIILCTESVFEDSGRQDSVHGNLSSCEIGPNGILSHLVSLNTQPHKLPNARTLKNVVNHQNRSFNKRHIISPNMDTKSFSNWSHQIWCAMRVKSDIKWIEHRLKYKGFFTFLYKCHSILCMSPIFLTTILLVSTFVCTT